MEKLQFKFTTEELTDSGEIRGYGSLFNEQDRGRDVVVKGAFTKSLNRQNDLKMLWCHDPAQPIGVWTKAEEDTRGLYLEGRVIPEVAKGAEALALLRAKAIDGLSIGYRTVKSSKGSRGERRLEELELWEVSIVTFPMLPSARVTDVKQLSSIRDVETVLREAGVPNKFAKLVAMHGYEGAKSRLMPDTELEEAKRLLAEMRSFKERLNA